MTLNIKNVAGVLILVVPVKCKPCKNSNQYCKIDRAFLAMLLVLLSLPFFVGLFMIQKNGMLVNH